MLFKNLKTIIIIAGIFCLPFLSKAFDELNYYMSKVGMERIEGDAVDFTLLDISGRELSLKDFRGKVIFLNFWATWCYPCRMEMPSMENLYERFKGDGFVILGISLDRRRKKVERFLEEYGISFPILLDRDGRIADRYGVRGLPTTFIIDRRGKILGRAVGARDWFNKNSIKLIKYIVKGF